MMTVSLVPFTGSIGVTVNLSPTAYALFAGKFRDHAPRLMPDDHAVVHVYINLPEDTPEGIEWLMANAAWVKRRIYDWLIAPAIMN